MISPSEEQRPILELGEQVLCDLLVLGLLDVRSVGNRYKVCQDNISKQQREKRR